MRTVNAIPGQSGVSQTLAFQQFVNHEGEVSENMFVAKQHMGVV